MYHIPKKSRLQAAEFYEEFFSLYKKNDTSTAIVRKIHFYLAIIKKDKEKPKRSSEYPI